MKKIIFAALLALPLAACDDITQNSDQIQRKQQEQLSKQAAQEVGLPVIKNFQEKRILKDILELRDQPNLVTYTYISDMNGHLHKLCDSIGYGVPYATQFTNPQRVGGGLDSPSTGNVTLPQADPNGLFSPEGADGTWVLCKAPGKDDVKPVFVEPRITVAPFPLDL